MESQEKGKSPTNDVKNPASVEERTRWCIDTINKSADADLNKVVLLLGRPGVGKSSFLENVTGASGHVGHGRDPVTKRFQLEIIKDDLFKGGQCQFFVMDTPGINTGAEAASLGEIARGLNSIRSKARIVGVLYVSKINDRDEDIDDRLRAFIQSFCGSSFMSQVTFITTHWTAEVEEQRYIFNQNLKELQGRCQKIYANPGPRFYEHGRIFLKEGGSTEFLSWWLDREDIACHAKNMLHTWYGVRSRVEGPHFSQQLGHGTPALETDAAKALGVFHSPASNQSWFDRLGNILSGFASTISYNEGGLSVTLSSSHQADNIRGNFERSFPIGNPVPNWGGSSRQPRTWPAHLDRNSARDSMKARGYNGDIGTRKQKAGSWGVTLPGNPGDANWNIAFLKELNKRDPW